MLSIKNDDLIDLLSVYKQIAEDTFLYENIEMNKTWFLKMIINLKQSVWGREGDDNYKFIKNLIK